MLIKVSIEPGPRHVTARITIEFHPAGPDGVVLSSVDVAVDERGCASPELWAAALRMAADKINPDAAALPPGFMAGMFEAAAGAEPNLRAGQDA